VTDVAQDPPDGAGAETPAEFVAALQQLRLWSGLSYRQLAAKATASGDVLPPSTIADALNRDTLPREEMVAAFVRACGLDHAAVTGWVAARRRLAVESVTPPAEDNQPVPEPEPQPPAPRRSWVRLAIIAAVSAVLAALGTFMLFRDDAQPQADSRDRPAPADGWYRIRPAHIPGRDLCFGEGRERNRRTVRDLMVQRPCADVVPDTYLERVGVGVYHIQWHHPQNGVGCLTVDDALPGPGALVKPADCTGAPHQRYLLEPVDTPVAGGFRMRPVHSGLCLGVLGGVEDVEPGAEAVQTSCSGQADQEFLLENVRRVPPS
jgi:hypothetical protein